MALSTGKRTTAYTKNGNSSRRAEDITAFCPSCKSFETIWVEGGALMSTRKFSQRGNQIFHDCGSDRPCRLYRNS